MSSEVLGSPVSHSGHQESCSCGETNASMDRSVDSDLWLTSPETGIANGSRVVGGRAASNQVSRTGLFCKQRRTMRASAGARGQARPPNSGGSCFRAAFMVSAAVSRGNAQRSAMVAAHYSRLSAQCATSLRPMTLGTLNGQHAFFALRANA